MPDTTDADLLAIMNRICHHQVAKGAHPLTCGNDSRHQNLFPVIHGRRVILRCVDCDYAQEHIPGLFVKEARAAARPPMGPYWHPGDEA